MRALAAGIGALMILVGVLWTLQGLGHVGGSSMSGDDKWAVIGPAVAGLGVALMWVAFGRGRSGS